jgi:oligosaccharide repeat unit polymerase
VFHFGLIAQDGFGILKVADFRGDFGRWMMLAGWYTNLALGCLGFAFAATCLYARPPPPIAGEAAARLATSNLNRLRNLGIGLCFACIAFLAIGILQVGNILSYERLTLFFGGMDIRGVGLFTWTAPSAALALAVSAQTRRQKRWSYATALATLVIFLLSGNRSMALFPLLVGVVLWVKTGRQIPILAAAGLLALILLIIPVVGTLRDMGTYENLSIHSIAKSSADANISSALTELGGSAGLLAITLQTIPAQEPYRIGASYLGYLWNIIPNVGTHLRLSRAPREIMKESPSFTEGMLRLSPSAWASVKVLGVNDALYQNYGVGFSAVAEPYFNFGYSGVVVFFLLVGFFLARMDCNNLPLEYSWLVFASIFYWLLILTVRNEFDNFTTPASYTAISLGVWLLLRPFTPFARP